MGKDDIFPGVIAGFEQIETGSYHLVGHLEHGDVTVRGSCLLNPATIFKVTSFEKTTDAKVRAQKDGPQVQPWIRMDFICAESDASMGGCGERWISVGPNLRSFDTHFIEMTRAQFRGVENALSAVPCAKNIGSEKWFYTTTVSTMDSGGLRSCTMRRTEYCQAVQRILSLFPDDADKREVSDLQIDRERLHCDQPEWDGSLGR